MREVTDVFVLDRESDPVVVRIAFAVEHEDVSNFAHGRNDGFDLGEIAAFGKIRNAFNQALHGYFFFVSLE